MNIFISSTCYDLSQVRADMYDFIVELGHNPIMSESKDFPINPQLSTMENCISVVRDSADVLVLIIGNRYGAELDTGKSITNTEFLTALRKGIPIYTFTHKALANCLPVWEQNPNCDFSNIVDNVKVFEFLSDVRKNKKLWNFEFEKVQDIINVLRTQFSYLFKDALNTKRKLVDLGIEDLYSKVSPKALNILLKKEDVFELKFFLQSIIDEIAVYSDLKKDYEYSMKLQYLHFRISDSGQLVDWLQLKLGQLENYVDSLNNILKAYNSFYGAPGVPSDLEGLTYVARSYAKLYSRLLEWGIEVRSSVVHDDFQPLMSTFAEYPNNVIKELEEYPINSLNKISELETKLLAGEIEPGLSIKLALSLTIDKKVAQRYQEELNTIARKYKL